MILKDLKKLREPSIPTSMKCMNSRYCKPCKRTIRVVYKNSGSEYAERIISSLSREQLLLTPKSAVALQ